MTFVYHAYLFLSILVLVHCGCRRRMFPAFLWVSTCQDLSLQFVNSKILYFDGWVRLLGVVHNILSMFTIHINVSQLSCGV